jgi:hypothetical protein
VLERVDLSETYMFTVPTILTIDLLDLVGGDGPHSGITRSCSYVFDGSTFNCAQLVGQAQADFAQTFSVNPGIRYSFMLDTSIAYATGPGVEDSSAAITYGLSVPDGQIQVVPEPASFCLIGIGLLVVLGLKKLT